MRVTNVLAGHEWLAIDVLIFILGAVVVTILLVFVRKERRDRAESTSQALRSRLVHALETADESRLRDATAGLADAGASDQTDLLAVLDATQNASWWTDETTNALRSALNSHGVITALQRQLTARSAAERGTAVLLGSHPACRLPTDHIARLMRDANSTVRLAAAAALARTRSAEAAHALVDGLLAQALPDARIIERLGHPWAVEVCIERLRILDDSHRNTVRASLARCLGLAGEPGGIPALLWLLDDGDRNEAIQAMRALAECAPQSDKATRREIADVARRGVQSTDDTLVLMAVRTLAVAGHKRDIGRFAELVGHRDWHVRREAALALAHLGKRGIEALRSVADGPDPYAAARAREELQIAGVDGDRGDW